MTERVTSIQIGEGKEVQIEDLLMKMATAEVVIRAMAAYIEHVERNGDAPGIESYLVDPWAITGLSQNMFEVSHALKCACFGHELAHLS